MKLVTAIIQPDKLDEVREALIDARVTRITVGMVSGHARQVEDDLDLYRGQKVIPTLIPKVRLDIACDDKMVKTICDTIVRAAKHGNGKIGDGKIFITSLEDCIRIRTEEKGKDAI